MLGQTWTPQLGTQIETVYTAALEIPAKRFEGGQTASQGARRSPLPGEVTEVGANILLPQILDPGRLSGSAFHKRTEIGEIPPIGGYSVVGIPPIEPEVIEKHGDPGFHAGTLPDRGAL